MVTQRTSCGLGRACINLTRCTSLCHLLISVSPLLTVGPSEGVPPSFCNIDTEPYDQAGYKSEREEEGEPFPVASRLIDDGLDDVWADHAGSPVREAEQAEELKMWSNHLGAAICVWSVLTMLSKPGGQSSAIIV